MTLSSAAVAAVLRATRFCVTLESGRCHHFAPQRGVAARVSVAEIISMGSPYQENGEHGWHPPKSLDLDENFKPESTLFCRKLRFVAIYTLFGDLWAKKVPFWFKNSVGQEVYYYMLYITYFTELNLQICDYAQKQCI